MLTLLGLLSAATEVPTLPDNWFTLLLGPAGALVAAVYGFWRFSRGDWWNKEQVKEALDRTDRHWQARLDDKQRELDRALGVADKAMDGQIESATAAAERTRLEREVRQLEDQLRAGYTDAAKRIRRPGT